MRVSLQVGSGLPRRSAAISIHRDRHGVVDVGDRAPRRPKVVCRWSKRSTDGRETDPPFGDVA
ncbi:hypothetical protein ASG54_02575 [Aureimonas sp. Leaf460]|nr:hypothetical protein ASG54_02575 [Aureimonas sp. Leaf460]